MTVIWFVSQRWWFGSSIGYYTLALPAFLVSAESTDKLQLRILEKTAISEDLSRATALESWLNETNATQPTGSASHEQKN